MDSHRLPRHYLLRGQSLTSATLHLRLDEPRLRDLVRPTGPVRHRIPGLRDLC
jgi:hypothetical protein